MGLFDDFLGKIGTYIPNKEHVALWQDKFAKIDKEHADTKQQLAACQAECKRLEARLAKYEGAQQARECTYKGALFMRDKQHPNDWEEAAYCPNCKIVAYPFEGNNRFNCDRCGWASLFLVSDLAKVLAELKMKKI